MPENTPLTYKTNLKSNYKSPTINCAKSKHTVKSFSTGCLPLSKSYSWKMMSRKNKNKARKNSIVKIFKNPIHIKWLKWDCSNLPSTALSKRNRKKESKWCSQSQTESTKILKKNTKTLPTSAGTISTSLCKSRIKSEWNPISKKLRQKKSSSPPKTELSKPK